MKNQTRLFITMSPETGNDTTLTYNTGLVTIIISPGKNLKVTGIDSFFLYNEELMLLDYGNMNTQNMERSGRTLKLELTNPRVWLPGGYILLLRYGEEEVQRFDLTLDEHATWQSGEPRRCGFISQELALSNQLCKKVRMWQMLSMRPGMRQFRQLAIQRAQLSNINMFRSTLLSVEDMEPNNNFIVYASGYDWIHQAITLFRSIVNLKRDIKWVDCATLYDPTTNNPYEKLNELFAGGTSDDNPLGLELPTGTRYLYCVTNISALLDNGGKQMLKKLRQHWDEVMLIGSHSEVENLMEQNPSLRDQFPRENTISVEPFTITEMIHWTLYRAISKYRLYFAPQAVDRLCHLMVEAYQRGTICQWTFKDIDHYLEQHVKPNYLQRFTDLLKSESLDFSDVKVQPVDIGEELLHQQASSYESALEELNSMVGLTDIKQSLTTIANNMHLTMERQRLGLHSSGKCSHHAIFMGSPGTGKTTVARLLGKIYHSLGLLSKGDVITVDRTRIIGRYIGETEENMKQILLEARGNVLFVDEAYTLYSNDSGNDFGRRAVECLLSVLAQKNPDMLIIFAGYQDEMDRLMSMNPGLVGRFPYKFLFKDYSADELMQIARTLLERDEYLLSSDAEQTLQQAIRQTVAQKNKNFGNARWIEQFVSNGIIPALANRLAATAHPVTREVYQRIEASDIQRAFEQFNPKTIELKPHRQVGFSA